MNGRKKMIIEFSPVIEHDLREDLRAYIIMGRLNILEVSE